MPTEFFGEQGSGLYKTSLARSPFNSRFSDFENTDENYVFIGFTPGLPLQAAELNELQDNFHKVSTLNNLFLSYWNVYLTKTLVDDASYLSGVDSFVETSYFYSALPIKPTLLAFQNVNGSYTLVIGAGWYYVKDLSGVGFWTYFDRQISVPITSSTGFVTINITTTDIFASDLTNGDDRLYDNSSGFPNYNSTGSYRVKKYISSANFTTAITDQSCVLAVISSGYVPQYSNGLQILESN